MVECYRGVHYTESISAPLAQTAYSSGYIIHLKEKIYFIKSENSIRWGMENANWWPVQVVPYLMTTGTGCSPHRDREQDEVVDIENGWVENAKHTIRSKSVRCITAALLECKCNLVGQYFLLSWSYCITQALLRLTGTLSSDYTGTRALCDLTSFKIRADKEGKRNESKIRDLRFLQLMSSLFFPSLLHIPLLNAEQRALEGEVLENEIHWLLLLLNQRGNA